MRDTVRSLLAEPRPPDAPQRVWRDWLLVAALVTTALLEVVLRQDLVWWPTALLAGLTVVLALLWRRTHPLQALVVALGALIVVDVVTRIGTDAPSSESVALWSTASMLVLVYALVRWGSGRDIALALPVILAFHVVRQLAYPVPLGEAVFGVVFFLFVGAIGASVRYRANARSREFDQVKLREREQLARELHDTVAHHVSAIVIQAQAGRTVAASDPGRALHALEVIEEAASRTLAEMRTMVGLLRTGEEAELAPQPGVADITRLARSGGDWPRVTVELSGDLADLRPTVGTALYRLAQESITNAARHARHATHITVCVHGDDAYVHLRVCDDGDPNPIGRHAPGYGLVGMAERATLLGGTLVAGPDPERGWTVRAALPRAGAAV